MFPKLLNNVPKKPVPQFPKYLRVWELLLANQLPPAPRALAAAARAACQSAPPCQLFPVAHPAAIAAACALVRAPAAAVGTALDAHGCGLGVDDGRGLTL